MMTSVRRRLRRRTDVQAQAGEVLAATGDVLGQAHGVEVGAEPRAKGEGRPLQSSEAFLHTVQLFVDRHRLVPLRRTSPRQTLVVSGAKSTASCIQKTIARKSASGSGQRR
jgi:hypothetical protein